MIFVLLCLLFLQPISNLLDYGDHPEFIAMMAVVVALDSFQCIPFAYLRYKKRPVKFAAIKLLSIIGGIVLGYIWKLIFDAFLRSASLQPLLTNATYGFWGLVVLVCSRSAI